MDEIERLRESMRDGAAEEFSGGRLTEEELERTFDEIARVDTPEEAELRGLTHLLPASRREAVPGPLAKSEPPSSFAFLGDQTHYLSSDQSDLTATVLLGDLKIDCLRTAHASLRLDLVNLIGDIVLRLPHDYQVVNRLTTVLGEYKDRDLIPVRLDPAKSVTLTGFHLLGDVKIKRY
jgi:hypothetical protein